MKDKQGNCLDCDTCQETATHFLWSKTHWELSAYDNPDVTVNSAEGNADKQRFCKECATEQGYLDEESEQAK